MHAGVAHRADVGELRPDHPTVRVHGRRDAPVDRHDRVVDVRLKPGVALVPDDGRRPHELPADAPLRLLGLVVHLAIVGEGSGDVSGGVRGADDSVPQGQPADPQWTEQVGEERTHGATLIGRSGG